MPSTSLDQERDAVDIVTNSMFSLDFLKSITDLIFSPNRDSMTVGEFYDLWLRESTAQEPKIPFNLGAIIGYLYCGILLTKENWYRLIPDIPLRDLTEDWGLNSIVFTMPNNQNATLRMIFRRLRNSLGHGNMNIIIPSKGINRLNIMRETKIHFHDENLRNISDTFDADISLDALTRLVKQIQKKVHEDVISRII